jgi:ketosteroid isomerase-like protein
MKTQLCLTLLGVVTFAAFGQQTRDPSPLESMIAAERAFARTSEETGTGPAFKAFIADDGILFRPTAVNGKQWFAEHPTPAPPPAGPRPLLNWQPEFAEIAAAGDMGYTTGPWQLKADIKDAKPSGFGHFLTVWKKQSDGSWKFAIDLGISYPSPNVPANWQMPRNYKQPAPGQAVNVSTEAAALLAREREFSSMSAMRGARAAFESFAADDVRLYRNEKPPVLGKAKAAAVLSTKTNAWTWQPAFTDVSRSGDLGYSYGTYRLEAETGNFFRIWKKVGRDWKVVADVADPLPPEAK